MSEFDAPGTAGETFKPADAKGHLLIVQPVEHRNGIVTTFGEKDAISVNVVDLDDHDPTTGEAGRVYMGALWFSGQLVGSLKSKIDKKVLGRMSQGVAKVGQSPPWFLAAANEDPAAVARATEWTNSHPGALDGFTSPAPTAPLTAPPTAPPAPAAVTDAAALAGISPEALALIQQMQATGQLPKAG